MNKEELKPCRICDGEGVLKTTYDTEQIICKTCRAKTQLIVGDYYDEGFMDGMYVIPKWNRGEIS